MLYLVLAALVWGSSFPVIQYTLRDVSPVLFLILRFAVAFVILLPRYWRAGRVKTLFGRDLVLIGLLNMIAFVCQYKAQELTTASKTALFINSNPVFVAVFSVFLVKERFTKQQLAALVLALSGVVITSTRLDFSGFAAVNTGDLFAILAGLLWAFFVIYSGGLAKKYGAFNMSQALCFWAALGATPLLVPEDVHFAWRAAPAVLYLAVFTTILAYFFFLKGVQSVSPLSTSIVILVEVVVAFLISHFFLGESFSGIETVGVVLVLAGVVMVVARRRGAASSGS
jgi:drug/metabolite transporter (DMT)-like permease